MQTNSNILSPNFSAKMSLAYLVKESEFKTVNT